MAVETMFPAAMDPDFRQEGGVTLSASPDLLRGLLRSASALNNLLTTLVILAANVFESGAYRGRGVET